MWILTSDSENYGMELCCDAGEKQFFFTYLFSIKKIIFFYLSILTEIDVVSPSNLIMG